MVCSHARAEEVLCVGFQQCCADLRGDERSSTGKVLLEGSSTGHHTPSWTGSFATERHIHSVILVNITRSCDYVLFCTVYICDLFGISSIEFDYWKEWVGGTCTRLLFL